MITSIACRTIAEALLSGHTAAGTRVMLSPTDPITHMLQEAQHGISGPVIAIYTGHAKREPKDRSIGGVTEQSLVIYVYIPPSAVRITEDGLEVTFDNRNAAMTLDVMSRQIDRAMRFGPEPWQSLWTKLIASPKDISQKPILVEIEKGVPIPAFEITHDFTTLQEPKYGTPTGFWAEFIAALAATGGEGAVMADLITKLIEAPEGLSEQDLERLNAGLNRPAYDNIGTGLLVDPLTGNPPLLSDPDGINVIGNHNIAVPGVPLP